MLYVFVVFTVGIPVLNEYVLLMISGYYNSGLELFASVYVFISEKLLLA